MRGGDFGRSPPAVLPSVATVANLPDTAVEGSYRWVESRGRCYQFVDDDWVSRPETSSKAWASASLSISASGDDDAPGTAQDPIRTLAEFDARTGQIPISAVSLDVLDSLNAGAVTLGGPCDAVATRYIWITGAGKAQADSPLTTTIAGGGVTAWNLSASSNTVGTMTGTASLTARAGSAGLSGYIFEIVGGARDGALFVLGAVESGSAVKFVPAIVSVLAPDTVTPAAGDTIRAWAPPRLCDTLAIRPGVNVAFVGLDIGTGAHAIQVPAASKAYFSGCKLRGGLDVLQAGSVEVTGCGVDESLRAEGDGNGGSARLLVAGSHVRAIIARPQTSVTVSDLLCTQYLSIESAAVMSLGSGFVFVDTPGTNAAAIIGRGGTLDLIGVLNGRGVAGSPARVQVSPSGNIWYAQKPNITGTGSEWSANGTTGNFSALPTTGGSSSDAFIVAR